MPASSRGDTPILRAAGLICHFARADEDRLTFHFQRAIRRAGHSRTGRRFLDDYDIYFSYTAA